MLFPSTCQFCNKRFLSPNLSNCCVACYKLYKAGKFKKKTKKKSSHH